MEIIIWIVVIIAVIAIIVWLLRRDSHPDPQAGTAPEAASRTEAGSGAAHPGQQRGSGSSSSSDPIVQSAPPVSSTAAASSAGAAAAAGTDESYESSLEQEDHAAEPTAGTGQANVPPQPAAHHAAAAEGSDGYTDTGRLYRADDPSAAPGREVAGTGSAKAAGSDDTEGGAKAAKPTDADVDADTTASDDTEGGSNPGGASRG